VFKIQTLNHIAAAGLNQFPSELYTIATEVSDPDAILVRSHVLHGAVIPESVKAVGRAGAGVNNIPINELTKRGVPVFNTPGANANAVCELVIAAMLLASRHICQAWLYVRQLPNDEALEKNIEQHKKQFAGHELMGKTLGLVGLGRVGVKVANAAIHLGMHVIGYDPTITVNRAWELSANVQQARSLEELLAKSHFVSFHVPLTATTKNMIGQTQLQLMRQGVVLLNFARDSIIQQEALLAALNEKKVKYYVNDFPNASLKQHADVISLPHLGASTHEAEENCAVMLVKQIRDYLEHGSIVNAVNFPTIEIPAMITKKSRLVIVNANIPNMVAQISAKLAAVGLNIVSLFNQSQDQIAYTVIDLDHIITDKIMREMGVIQGVIQVRKI